MQLLLTNREYAYNNLIRNLNDVLGKEIYDFLNKKAREEAKGRLPQIRSQKEGVISNLERGLQTLREESKKLNQEQASLSEEIEALDKSLGDFPASLSAAETSLLEFFKPGKKRNAGVLPASIEATNFMERKGFLSRKVFINEDAHKTTLTNLQQYFFSAEGGL